MKGTSKMSEQTDKKNILDSKQSEQTYNSIRNYVIIYKEVNNAMTIAYWNIGKTIYEVYGENGRAAYGKQILQYISERIADEFGKGFTVRNLRHMRQFYLAFPIRNTLCAELSWSHYRLLMRVSDEKARNFYTEEAVKSGWSVRQLERQINIYLNVLF